MSTHPRVTVEGLDPFMWIAARWMGIDAETARDAVARMETEARGPEEDGCCAACWCPVDICECGHWSRET